MINTTTQTLRQSRALMVPDLEVQFPAYAPGERCYMVPFVPRFGLPDHLAKWQPFVDSALGACETLNSVYPHLGYLTIDCRVVMPGKTHRRPGIHVEGYWEADDKMHRGGGHVSGTLAGMRPGKWKSDKEQGPLKKWKSGADSWEHATLQAKEAIVLIADQVGCDGFTGEWSGPIGEGGDVSKCDLSLLERFRMQANRVYVGGAAFVHEPLVLQRPTLRSVVRITLPGWEPNWSVNR